MAAREVWIGRLLWLALAGDLICQGTHYCMCGHLAHVPDLSVSGISDIAWLTALSTAGVFSVRSQMPCRGLVIAAAPVMVAAQIQSYHGRGILSGLEAFVTLMLFVLVLVHRAGRRK